MKNQKQGTHQIFRENFVKISVPPARVPTFARSPGWRDSVEKIAAPLRILKGSAPRKGAIFRNFYLAGATWYSPGSRRGAKRIGEGAPPSHFWG